MTFCLQVYFNGSVFAIQLVVDTSKQTENFPMQRIQRDCDRKINRYSFGSNSLFSWPRSNWFGHARYECMVVPMRTIQAELLTQVCLLVMPIFLKNQLCSGNPGECVVVEDSILRCVLLPVTEVNTLKLGLTLIEILLES